MADKKTLYVCHGMYGCETGCCGYRLCLDDEGDKEESGTRFTFSHPPEGETPEDFARDQWDVSYDVEILPGKWYKC